VITKTFEVSATRTAASSVLTARSFGHTR
jgi:hypothetical protein